MFSKACAALLNGMKLIRPTILPNLLRSCTELCIAADLRATFSASLASKTAYPEADSNSTWVIILEGLCKFFSSDQLSGDVTLRDSNDLDQKCNFEEQKYSRLLQ